MKTQLLEDIGQSATLSLVPSKVIAAEPKADRQEQVTLPRPNVEPVLSRSGFGVWRQKPPAEITSPGLAEPPTSVELNHVFEEIAALEAQYVRPLQQDETSTPRAEPQLATLQPESLSQTALAPAEPTLGLVQTNPAPEPRDILFEFTPSSPAAQASDPFSRPAGIAPSGQRYLRWGACVLAGVMLIQGGRWLFSEREAAGSLTLVAAEAKEEPQMDKAVKRRVVAAKEFTLGPTGEVRVAPPAPPLVLLKPDAPPPVEVQPSSSSTTDGVARQSPNKQLEVVAEPTDPKHDSETRRQTAPPSAAGGERKATRESSMAATLKACRQHGYHAEQCLKRACSLSKYGFACRG